MIYNSRELRKSDFATGNLLETKRKVAAAKKRDAIWPFFAMPLAVAWAAWGGWEMGKQLGDVKFFVPFFIICVTAGVVGGLMIHFRTQRHYRDIIEQIEDLEDSSNA